MTRKILTNGTVTLDAGHATAFLAYDEAVRRAAARRKVLEEAEAAVLAAKEAARLAGVEYQAAVTACIDAREALEALL